MEFNELVKGKNTILMCENEKVKEYMVAVRDENNNLLGYFEIIQKLL
ncbi:MAG: hypothetical protein ACP5H0_06960 [Caldisericum sp.]|jgi:hypothetical protein